MKYLSLLRNSAVALALCAGFTACSDDDDAPEDTTVEYDVTLNVKSGNFAYTTDGYWDKVYTNDALVIDGIKFSHTGGSSEYAGVTYYSWNGFCPSKSTDNADVTGTAEWTDHQWGAMTKGGLAGEGTPYLVVGGSVSASADDEPVMKISMDNKAKFKPAEVYVTNTAYAYYVIKNGSAFSRPFTSSDKFTLDIYGVNGEDETGHIQVLLANGTDLIDTWKKIDLGALGTVDYIYFTLSSTDSGQWGMNTPAFFALDGLSLNLN